MVEKQLTIQEIATESLAPLVQKRLDWLVMVLAHETWVNAEQVSLLLAIGQAAVQAELDRRAMSGAVDTNVTNVSAGHQTGLAWPEFSSSLGSVQDIGVDVAPEALAVEPQPEATELKAEAGKRYYHRRGTRTGVLTTDTTLPRYKLIDPLTGISYFENGRAFDGDRTDPHDLVREYVEPEEQEFIEPECEPENPYVPNPAIAGEIDGIESF